MDKKFYETVGKCDSFRILLNSLLKLRANLIQYVKVKTSQFICILLSDSSETVNYPNYLVLVSKA